MVPNAQATVGMSSATQNLFTIDNAHVVLTACGFEQTFIGAGCGIIDGVLYAFQGDWIGAGLSGLSAIPLIGGFADSARTAKVTAKAVQNASQVSHALASIAKADLPVHARQSLEALESSGWTRNWEGQKNGAVWKNEFSQLPTNVTYTEWDVVKASSVSERGLERFVKSSNGDLYYTSTHYGDNLASNLPAFYLIK